MLLSSNVIKKVSCELENCSVYPKMGSRVKVKEEIVTEPVDLESIKRQADTIISNAQAKAEMLLREASDRVLLIEKEAYEKGYQKGEQDAHQAEAKARSDFNAAIKKKVHEIEQTQANIYRDTEEELVELAMSIAEKLVCRQLDIMPETIADIAKVACNEARDCKEIVLHVPTEQLEIIEALQSEIRKELYKTEHFAVIADPNIKSGGCWIETEQGYIDARLATMSEHLGRVLKEDCV